MLPLQTPRCDLENAKNKREPSKEYGCETMKGRCFLEVMTTGLGSVYLLFPSNAGT
jgi:hypothetical protein